YGRGIFWEEYGYVGLVTILMAGLALLRRPRSWHVRFFAASALVGYLLVLGKNTPAFGLAFDLVPLMSFFRFPTRLLFVVDALFPVLAALGLAYLPPGRAGTGRVPWLSGAAVLRFIVPGVAVLDLLTFQLRQNAIVDLDRWRTPPRTADVLRSEASTYRIFTLGAE